MSFTMFVGSLMLGVASLPWKDILTIGAATLGAVLGVMNTWNSLSQRRVKLLVRPKHVAGAPTYEMFSIEVINLSSFPVNIDEVGFSVGRRRIGKHRRSVWMCSNPRKTIDGKPWPARLEHREAVTIYFDLRIFSGADIGKAYAMTTCNEIRYGESPALKQFRKIVKE